MTNPYPKQGGRAASGRPSTSSGGRAPVYPANDRYYGDNGSHKAKPAYKGALQPNAFQRPAISYGKPLAIAPPVYRIPDTISGTSYLHIGSRAVQAAAKGLGAWQLFEVADAITAAYLAPATGLGLVPTGGFFQRTRGPNIYGHPNVGGPAVAFSIYEGNPTGFIINQAIANYQGDGVFAVPAGWTQAGIWYRRVTLANRYAQHSAWRRVASAALANNVAWRPHPVPLSAGVGAAPWADPLATPIGGRAPAIQTPYAFIPKIGVNPMRVAAYQHAAGYAVATAQPNGAAAPAIDFPIGYPFVHQFPTYGPKPISFYSPPARPAPPKKNEHHSKWIGGWKSTNAAMRAISLVTEGLDLVNAIHKSLPKEAKTGYYELHYKDPKTGEVKTYMKYRHKASVQDKINDLIRNADDIDLNAAVSNIIDNEIQDRALGGAAKAGAAGRRRQVVNLSKQANDARAKNGRRYRALVPRRKKDEYVDLGPRGRGNNTGGNNRADTSNPLEGGPRW